ncbi:ER membrane glycoprotein subunit of the GPI transamidase complex-like protein [Saitozyma podzolica]|uniref:GPI mannosyltransferase 2 n=1 Tax=Saitozyma podzolica TaxID=1890683 RepID=A0A427YHF6_9TREE|nr:ER membrane glycoprotein subunit of the GPI transamidase complex-like protein [Saitozyma podzolica]
MGLGPPRDPRTEAGLQRSTSTGSPIRTIALLALLSRIVPLALLHLLPIRTFDASASLLSPPTSSGISLTPLTTYTPPTLRWDAIHFATIALRGYTFEQQLAFQPGWPLVMRVAGEGVWWAKRLFAGLVSGDSSSILTSNDVVLGGVIAANAAFVGAAIMLYKYVKTPFLALVFPLTSQTHLPNHLSLLRTTHYIPVPPPPTPAVLSSPYTEPLFALLTFTGFFLAVTKRYLLSGLVLGLATSVRATGIFGVGVLGWIILFGLSAPDATSLRPSRLLRRSITALLPCTLVLAPFLIFQWYAYASFCHSSKTSRPWCNARPPVPYSFVQREYWNMGLLEYWTPAQLPNFLIAAPVLLVSLIPSFVYFRQTLSPVFARGKSQHLSAPFPPHASPALLPFHIHHLALTLLLIFASHTQISLRPWLFTGLELRQYRENREPHEYPQEPQAEVMEETTRA